MNVWMSVQMSYPTGGMLRRIESSVAAFPKAAMFGLADEGYDSLFEQLVSCIISIRTLDETTILLSRKLFAKARRPEDILRLSMSEIADLLHGATFPGQKRKRYYELRARHANFRMACYLLTLTYLPPLKV